MRTLDSLIVSPSSRLAQGPMDEPAAWRTLAASFLDLARNVDGAKLYVGWPPEEDQYAQRWFLAGTTNQNVKNAFLSFAERAGVLLGKSPGSIAIECWIELLHMESPRKTSMAHVWAASDGEDAEADGEVIHSACIASKEQCYKMETQAIAKVIVDPPISVPTSKPPLAFVASMIQQDETSQPINRTELRDHYLARFSSKLQILDICWAAGQHYSEWKRWLRGAKVLKDGSAPDLAFRSLLSSGKPPSEHRKQPRPKGWK
jgi:hypothetical protein